MLKYVLAASALMLGILGSACTGRSASTPSPAASGASTGVASSKEHRAAPEFELKDFQGKTHGLEEFRGQPVILHFWASWCAPCIEELPQWIEMVKSMKGKPIRFVAISLDKTWPEAEKILPQKDLPDNLMSLIDTEQSVPEKFGSFQFPETYLLNREHKILEKWVGAQDWSGGATRALIDRVASGG